MWLKNVLDPGTVTSDPARKKVVYISGPITGKANYQKDFERAEAELRSRGCTVLNPAKLPEGLTKAEYMRINFASIDSADAVLLLPDWCSSPGASLEWMYCEYIGKPCSEDYDKIAEVPV